MQYQGGKTRISATIAEKIRGGVLGNTLVSLFCGSCAVEAKLAPFFDTLICNDAHPYLIAMWQALKDGWEPPDIVTEAEYQYIKDHKDEDPALSGFVGFGCTFGAKWFAGYARDKRGHAGGGTQEGLKHPSLKSFRIFTARITRAKLAAECSHKNRSERLFQTVPLWVTR